MEKYMMVDIETLGVDVKNHDILQIGILECIKNSRGFYIPGRSFNKIIFSDQETTDPWILKNHSELLPLSRAAAFESPTEIRAQILSFFQQCGVDKANLMGLNACVFDIPSLVNHGYLKSGDYHYRVYELTGAYNLAQDALGLDRRDKLFAASNEACEWITLPTGKKHEALYDCYAQLKNLNGCIKLLQTSALASRSAPSPEALT